MHLCRVNGINLEIGNSCRKHFFFLLKEHHLWGIFVSSLHSVEMVVLVLGRSLNMCYGLFLSVAIPLSLARASVKS